MTKLFAKNEDPITLCGYQMSLGGIVLTLIGTALKGKINIIDILPVFLGLTVIYAVSYTLWTFLLKHNPPSSITIYSFMTPVFGVIFSAFLLSEDGGVSTANLIIALIMICIGIILWGYERKEKPIKK